MNPWRATSLFQSPPRNGSPLREIFWRPSPGLAVSVKLGADV